MTCKYDEQAFYWTSSSSGDDMTPPKCKASKLVFCVMFFWRRRLRRHNLGLDRAFIWFYIPWCKANKFIFCTCIRDFKIPNWTFFLSVCPLRILPGYSYSIQDEKVAQGKYLPINQNKMVFIESCVHTRFDKKPSQFDWLVVNSWFTSRPVDLQLY